MSELAQSAVRRPQIARAIAQHWRDFGYAPSVRDVAAAIGLGSTSTFHWMERMRDEGLVLYRPDKGRTLRLTPDGEALADL